MTPSQPQLVQCNVFLTFESVVEVLNAAIGSTFLRMMIIMLHQAVQGGVN